MSEDRTEYFFDFSLPFSIHDDNEILKRMGLADPYWKQHTQQQHPLTQQHPLSQQLVLPPQHGLSQQPLTQQPLSQQQFQQHHQQQHHLHHQQHHPHPLGEISDFSIMDHFNFNPN